MARPVYVNDQLTAQARLKSAFWELLSENGYKQITVRKLSAKAGVNPNTFYYHYDSMDSLAFDALDDEKLFEIPSLIHSGLPVENRNVLSETLEYISFGERWKKIRLFVSSDSIVLRRHFYNMLEQFWLSVIGVEKDKLAKEDYDDLTFILNGALSIVSRQTKQLDLSFIKTLPERPLGQGILQTMDSLSRKYKK